ncbi:metal ABC transporter ATP-binding protein [Litoribrevibacter euphylliae]|uniref:Metal ABC transporter ATP-binding protein n=1 Tax=Litoribrevibacter euphylliae TaxID=1834034 RepID=A0ABV7HAX2_9GAMM
MIPSLISGPSLTLDNVSLTIGSQRLLDAIHCEFESGQWHAVLGPNGGGKSTLLKTILGLTPHSGSIKVNWPKEALTGAKSKRGNIGYIPQLMPFDASLPISVRDYLLMSLSSRPIWFKRKLPKTVETALEHIQLKDKLDRRIGDLSGGERQRLMLTTAMLQNPSLLILDEPMTGLDKTGQQETLSLLSKFHQAGGTIVMVEHDWNIVKNHCDQVYWIDSSLKLKQSATEFFEQAASSNQEKQGIELSPSMSQTANHPLITS